MKKFLLIDDHEVVRSGINGLLSAIYKPCEVDEASNTDMAAEKLKQHTYDLIMMDIQMPKSDSLGMMEYIHVRYPAARVLIFSMSSETIYAKRFLKAGAKGFLSKDASLDEIKKAINLNNRRYVSDTLAESLAFSSVSNTPENPFEKLSQREFEIASLLLSGQSVSEVSRSLNLQTSTVGTHKSRIFEKLGIDNILALKELATSYNL
jgi:two-component system, NarL family, invasion response regulator UvrY